MGSCFRWLLHSLYIFLNNYFRYMAFTMFFGSIYYVDGITQCSGDVFQQLSCILNDRAVATIPYRKRWIMFFKLQIDIKNHYDSASNNFLSVKISSITDLLLPFKHKTHHKKGSLFPPGIEPGAFRVLGGCDNHYTTETAGFSISGSLTRHLSRCKSMFR